MIAEHEFNSRWWGAAVGVVTDDALFALAAAERARVLAPWSWVERRAPLAAETSMELARAGFAQVDAQLGFRIGLAGLVTTPSVERLEAEFADETPFSVGPLADFRHERFLALPGADAARVNRRYALWSEDLLAEHPDTCVRVLEGGEVQGWFLSRRTEKGLELTLASLARDARISGHGLYQRALLAYRARGFRIGYASFSVRNTAVLGIYASLGARFVAPSGCWLWHPDTARDES